jgi:hypothetical protein
MEFQPTQVGPVPVGGILDYLSLLKLLKNAIMAKDVDTLRSLVRKVADLAGYGMEANELDDVVTYIVSGNAGGIVYEIGDAMEKFAVKYMGFVPPAAPTDGAIRVMVEHPHPAPKAVMAFFAAIEAA